MKIFLDSSRATSVNDTGHFEEDDVELLLESDHEIDNLEADVLYDSDDDVEYVPSAGSESDDEEEGFAVGPESKKRKVFTSTPIKRFACASTSAAVTPDPASSSVVTPDLTSSSSAIPDPASSSAVTRDPASSSSVTPDLASSSAVTSAAAASSSAVTPDPASNCGRRRQRRQDSDVPPVVDFGKMTISSANNFVWSCQSQHAARVSTSARNLVSFTPGPTNEAKGVIAPDKTFNLFFTDDMIQLIVTWTNAKIARVCESLARRSATNSFTEATEIRALLGVLLVTGQQKDNHLSTAEMWSTVTGCPLYRAAMSKCRFEFLIACMRFDNPDTYAERQQQDKFAHVRELWDSFIANCSRLYEPHDNLTVDEQLLGFRGNCPFRMYIPNKPAKYGIKLVLICDSDTKYMLGGIPYLGKQDTTSRSGVNLGHYYTVELTRPYHGSNRNVTTDNWFTSVPLITDLLTNYGMTLVGTVRGNKREIPLEMKAKETRQHGSSAFLHTKEMTMVSYVAKTSKTKKKVAFLLSSQHTQPTVAASGKPEIMEFYNATKGGVDTFDQMCAVSSCSRKTRRWPLCVMYGMLNGACINSYIISCENREERRLAKISRREYILELGKSLITPWAQRRLSAPTLSRKLHSLITSVCQVPSLGSVASAPVTSFADRKSNSSRSVRCCECPPRSDRKTRHSCSKCDKPKCLSHLYPMCGECV